MPFQCGGDMLMPNEDELIDDEAPKAAAEK